MFFSKRLITDSYLYLKVKSIFIVSSSVFVLFFRKKKFLKSLEEQDHSHKLVKSYSADHVIRLIGIYFEVDSGALQISGVSSCCNIDEWHEP